MKQRQRNRSKVGYGLVGVSTHPPVLLRESVGVELKGRSNLCVCCCLLDVPVVFAGGATGCRRLRKWRRGLAALFGVCFV